MRFQKWFLFLGMAAALVLSGLFIGCSDDEKAPTGTVGSLTDAEFLAVQEIVDAIIDSTVANIGGAISTEGRIPADDSTIVTVFMGPNVPSDIIIDANYEYANGWHVLTLTSTSDDFDAAYQDSVRFTDAAGTAMENVVNPQSISFRRHWSFSPSDTTVTYASFVGAAELDLADVDSNVGTLNGERSLTVQSKVVTADSTVWREIIFDAQLSDVEFTVSPIAQLSGCPQGGTIIATLDMSRQKDAQAPVATSWGVTANFDAGDVDITVTQGTTTWTYSSEICH